MRWLFAHSFPGASMKACIRVAALLVMCASAAQASVHDHLFANGFDVPADAPANANDAARFLTKATF